MGDPHYWRGRLSGSKPGDAGTDLIFWTKKDQFLGLHSDFEWLAMSYAVPCSGILCLELLREAANPLSYVLHLPRSEVIQSLSLLVAYLDWIRSCASCGSMVPFIHATLSRCLDRILNAARGALAFPDLPLPDQSGLPDDPHLELLNTFD